MSDLICYKETDVSRDDADDDDDDAPEKTGSL
jgi:hypothetical protein